MNALPRGLRASSSAEPGGAARGSPGLIGLEAAHGKVPEPLEASGRAAIEAEPHSSISETLGERVKRASQGGHPVPSPAFGGSTSELLPAGSNSERGRPRALQEPCALQPTRSAVDTRGASGRVSSVSRRVRSLQHRAALLGREGAAMRWEQARSGAGCARHAPEARRVPSTQPL